MDNVTNKLKDTAEDVIDKAKDKTENIRDSLKNKTSEVQETLECNYEELLNKVKEKPLQSVLIAAGIGYLISKFIK
ncbi:hypothetical protein [uncultured Legionella sp.]|uniref:DUF883 family protein n=1 Tax=uncultured Legionella sp. TaxID=210934 RepID=UPI00260AEF86|nr:hypothetical protein [uncultured Legionella sp.]